MKRPFFWRLFVKPPLSLYFTHPCRGIYNGFINLFYGNRISLPILLNFLSILGFLFHSLRNIEICHWLFCDWQSDMEIELSLFDFFLYIYILLRCWLIQKRFTRNAILFKTPELEVSFLFILDISLISSW